MQRERSPIYYGAALLVGMTAQPVQAIEGCVVGLEARIQTL